MLNPETARRDGEIALLRADRDQWAAAQRSANTVLLRVLAEREHLLDVIHTTKERLTDAARSAAAATPPGYVLVHQDRLSEVIDDLAIAHGRRATRQAPTRREDAVLNEREVS
jgi:hypothetical protein